MSELQAANQVAAARAQQAAQPTRAASAGKQSSGKVSNDAFSKKGGATDEAYSANGSQKTKGKAASKGGSWRGVPIAAGVAIRCYEKNIPVGAAGAF